MSYLGDADVGADTNVGAGTITANYDGVRKYPTTIGERVFLGVDTMLARRSPSATRRGRAPGRSSRRTCRPASSPSACRPGSGSRDAGEPAADPAVPDPAAEAPAGEDGRP